MSEGTIRKSYRTMFWIAIMALAILAIALFLRARTDDQVCKCVDGTYSKYCC